MSFSDYYSGVQHIGIPTKNLEIAESFWTKLGFKKAGDRKSARLNNRNDHN